MSTIGFSSREIQRYRKLFPVTKNWIYLNHAGVAPISQPVFKAMQNVTREALEQGYALGHQWRDQVEKIRANMAAFIKAQAEEIAFVKNTSHGISLIAQGLDFKAGDEIILAQSEFPSNVYPWLDLQRKGVVIKKIPVHGNELQISALQKMVTPRTRLLALSSVEYGSGYRIPLESISRFCAEHRILFFLDAIQSIGVLPIDVSQCPIDFLSADAHKWILGPEGIGFLFVRKNHIKKIHPALIGWHSVVNPFDFDHLHFTLQPNAQRFEEGSPNTFSIYGLGAAIDLLAEIGIERIAQRVHDLTDILIDGLQRCHVRVTNSLSEEHRSGIVTCRFERASDFELLKAMEKHLMERGIFVTIRRGALRLSPHFYNTEAEIEKALSEIKHFMAVTRAPRIRAA